ncbi:MAG: hypothetical protein ACREID_04785 [Planctomycetota bacterium]
MEHPSQRGVALILVLVILPLVAILITQLHFETAVGDQLASNVLASQQFRLAIRARVLQMRLKLVRDLKEDEKNAEQGAFDHYGDVWGPTSEGGETAESVTKGDAEQGDDVTLYTEVIDEQGKLNLNLLRHTDVQRRAKAKQTLRALLDLFRDSRYADLHENDFDLDDARAGEVADAIAKFLEGEERDERIPKPQVPDPSPDMKQGIYTVEDLAFCHPLFQEKRLLETFTDTESRQTIPGLDRFLTLYGDGKINANTAPLPLLRALFREEEGQATIAEGIYRGRGGFTSSEEDKEARREKREDLKEAREDGDEEKVEGMTTAFKSLEDLAKVEGLNDPALLRRNDLDLGREFGVRTSFFTVIVTAQRENFLRQHRVVLERHSQGCILRESEVRPADLAQLPGEGVGTPGEESGNPVSGPP